MALDHCVTLCCLLYGPFPGPDSPLHPQHPAQGSAQSRHQGTFMGLSQCPEPPSLLRYWKLDPAQVYASGPNAWDTAVHDASEEYKHRMVREPPLRGTRVGASPQSRLTPPFLHLQHNLCCDNCHSHVALALNLMRYNNSTNWNMVTLCFFCLLYGKYVR